MINFKGNFKMQKKYLLAKTIMLIIFVIFIFCDEEDMRTKKLTLTDHTKQGDECYSVTCVQTIINGKVDTICTQYPGSTWAKVLPKNSVCYKCLKDDNPPSNPGKNPPADKTPAYNFKAIFPDSINYKYGSDLAYGSDKISAYLSERRINYFSIKEGGAIKIIVTISPERRRMFSGFNLKIKRNNISFDSVMFKDSIPLFNAAAQPDTVDTITLYGLSRTFSECPVTLTGVNRSGVESDLICPGTCDEEIAFLCYKEKVIDSLRVYMVNNPSFNQDSVTIKNEFNKILKQAAIRVAYVQKNVYNKMGWDFNKNDILDHFPINDSVPIEKVEFRKLIDSIQTTFTDCYSCADQQISKQTPKIIILPSSINSNWLLMENAAAGSDTIIVQYSNVLADKIRSVNFTLSSWDGTNSETFQLNNVISSLTDSIMNRMGLKIYSKNLTYAHPRHSVLVQKNNPKGFTIVKTSCALVIGSTNFHELIHEYLHMRKIGPLNHTIMDSNNVMFPTSPPSGSLLRYRQMSIDNILGNGFYERQWEVLQSVKN
jgi:hypothetical protein